MMLLIDCQSAWLFAWRQRPTRINRQFTRINSGDHALVFEIYVNMALVRHSKFGLAFQRNRALHRLALGIDCGNVAAASVAGDDKFGISIVDDDIRGLASSNLFWY